MPPPCECLAKTSDAGQTWTYHCLPLTDTWHVTDQPPLASARPRTAGWLLDDTLWRSTDGGDTWSEQHTFPEKLSWIQAENATRAWVQQGTRLWHTTDGGATWQLAHRGCARQDVLPNFTRGVGHGRQQHRQVNRRRRVMACRLHPAQRPGPQEWFWDALTGWRAAGSNIERTTDGGATWLSRGFRTAGGRRVQIRGHPQRLGLALRLAGFGPHDRRRRHLAGPEHRQRLVNRSPVRGRPARLGAQRGADPWHG